MTSGTRSFLLAFAALALALASAPAAAFPAGEQFDGDALATDGGGGIAFDGSPRYTGHTCAVCHTDAPGLVSLQLNADHPELFTSGWVPNMQYQLQVVLLNSHEALQYGSAGDDCGFAVDPYVPCKDNGFAFEVDNTAGQPVGSFSVFDGSANACVSGSNAPIDVDAYILNDGTAVVHSGVHHAQDAWRFCWTAPSAGAGLLDVYTAVVDGGSGNGSAFPDTPTGCDLFAGLLALPEQGFAPPPPESGGCDAGGAAVPGGDLVLAAVVLCLLLRRRGATAVALVVHLVAALATGCTHVRATQRETLARKNMQFGPDPIEDELDLHMQEAREGSAGGYGSSGGGCGCN